ncbi:PQQ-dependent sugar dehydrogenase [Chitinophaga sp. Ak27]|uniref:PQQ-dependent sugar dehydrogenase n=1 Tax=Chitinophaga sp. Ak27 TaxID=2726116 RepID=UPI00145C4300|nr:PQQ-dependent sugar dehydrogenase [Chitinophaga sp. Ak27]NLU92097.1 PKD domain-containing protein [Chitinophaga sp. Ak27]
MRKLCPLLLLVLLFACTSRRSTTRILCYATLRDSGWVKQIQAAAAKEGWQLVLTGDRHLFQEDSLREFSAVCLPFSLSDSLDFRQVPALKRYAESGGGGILAVKDTTALRKDWPWIKEWTSLPTGKALKQDDGRLYLLAPNADAVSFLTALTYLIGDNALPDYKQSLTLLPPDTSRYTYTVLDHGLDEPMEMCILPEGNVLFIERKGAVKLYDARQHQTKNIGHFDVFSGIEDGLLGAALDPNFKSNHRVYFYYAPAGEKWFNKLVRMELHGDTLDKASEKVMMEVPTQRRYCCHSAGYLAFGPGGLLYLSIGDNTNAEETEGYTPVDERKGRELSDDQASAANSKDLRGKILRIKPEEDGSYSIPDGNLFPKDGSQGRSEIYVMGCRNPYRFHVDMKNAFVYWGDIGPDTKVPSPEGNTVSFDELNQARKPGFFGWPYFNGNNQPYPLWDYAAKKERPIKDPQHPVNSSPNNTGVKNLPPAQPAMIWYSDARSPIFPMLGKGGESAMAGPVFYSDLYKNAPYKLSDYYNGKLFFYDWVRHWIMAVTMDKEGNYLRMEPFLEHIPFAAPVDMQIAPDGSIYMLEYGTNWFAKNSDAKLVQITYAEGNRNPVATISIPQQYGAAPFTAHLSAAASLDYDKNDQLTYTWKIGDQQLKGVEVQHTFTQPGSYKVTLTVMDDHGGTGTATADVKVGNTPPVVQINTTANRSFYWDNAVLNYQVSVKDPEDGKIDSSKVQVSFDYLPIGKDLALVLAKGSSAGLNPEFAKGSQLFWSLDCKACHAEKATSVGPALVDIAHRYNANEPTINKLAAKVIAGGSGNWGGRTMSSHPDMSKTDAQEIVKYILSLGASTASIPLQGDLPLGKHTGKGHEGAYLLMATYTDKGANGIAPITTRDHIMLRDPLLQIEDADEAKVFLTTQTTLALSYGLPYHNNFVRFNHLYLDGIQSVQYNIQEQGMGGVIEMRLDKPDGALISQLTIAPGKAPDAKTGWKVVAAPVKPVTGLHDIYCLFKSTDGKEGHLFNIDWLKFSNQH